MRELTFVINPFTSVESEKVVCVDVRNYNEKRDILNHQSDDFVQYSFNYEDGKFTVNDFFFSNQNKEVFGFKYDNQNFILGDKTIFSITTSKSEVEMLEILKNLVFVFNDEDTKRYVFRGIQENQNNKFVY